VLRELLGATFEGVLQEATGPAGQLLNTLYDALSKLSKALEGATAAKQQLTPVIDGSLTPAEADAVLTSVANKVLVAGALAALVVAFPESIAVIKEVAAAYALVATARAIGKELASVTRLVQKCQEFKRTECGSCVCAVESVTYSARGVETSCSQWTGSGSPAICLAIPGGSNECCTCDAEARNTVTSCARDLSFDASAMPTDYESCCRDAGAIVNPRSAAAPMCACQPG
jgi:hypothetical protein